MGGIGPGRGRASNRLTRGHRPLIPFRRICLTVWCSNRRFLAGSPVVALLRRIAERAAPRQVETPASRGVPWFEHAPLGVEQGLLESRYAPNTDPEYVPRGWTMMNAAVPAAVVKSPSYLLERFFVTSVGEPQRARHLFDLGAGPGLPIQSFLSLS